MNQGLVLTIEASGLRIQCSDHDDTTVMSYIILSEDDQKINGAFSISVSCDLVLQSLQYVNGDMYLHMLPDGSWSVQDLYGSSSSIWPNTIEATVTVPTGPPDCVVRMISTDFLLYVQHITLCESYVRVSSYGGNDISMVANGELLSIQIQNEEQASIMGTDASTVHCTFKYIRAVLAILTKLDAIDVRITNGQWLVLVAGPLTIRLKDKNQL